MEYRIATFNLENLDNRDPERKEEFKDRIKVLRPMLNRINADLMFLQEVNSLDALNELLEDTIYEIESYSMEHTVTTRGDPYNERNLVTLSRYNIGRKKTISSHPS